MVAPLEVAATAIERARGLLGRDHLDGALLLPVRSIHTIGMAMALDVALLSGVDDGRALWVARVGPGRLVRPRRGTTAVVEASAGAFAGWGLEVGARIDVVDEAGAPLELSRSRSLRRARSAPRARR